MATRRRTRKSKVVTNVKEEDNVNTEGQTETVSPSEEIVQKEEDAPTESTETKQEEENQNEHDSQMEMDTVIEVKGSQSTVTVSWDKKNEEGQGDDDDDAETGTNESGQMMDTADAVGSTEEAPAESTETNTKQETQESGEPRMDADTEENVRSESASTVTVTWKEKNEEGENGDVKKETGGGDEMIVKETAVAVNGKRKASSTVETSPSKKTKLINDGFCVFVGNLNNSKPFDEVKDSLASYFMTQSLLFQDIRLDRSRKHAYVDLASEMDLTKALALNGQMMLDKPMKIDKAKVKTEGQVKVKLSAEEKKAVIDARCLFLKNVPYNTTKPDLMKIFPKAIAVRFPGGTEGPNKGIAFVEFKNNVVVKRVLQRKREIKIQDRVLIVDAVGGAKSKAKDDNNNTKAAAPPNNTLFVSNLSFNVQENNLKKVFKKAVSITIPQSKGKARGFAFLEFATVADAEKALQSSKKLKINKREVKVQFCKMQEKVNVLPTTLIVMGLAEKTTEETLKNAFEGALCARIIMDKETGVSKRFGFVDFKSDESCKAVKEAMEDCEIDGCKVTVAYAKPKGAKGPPGARGGLTGSPGEQPAGQKADKSGLKDKGRKGRRGGKARGAGKPKDAAKEVGNKG